MFNTHIRRVVSAVATAVACVAYAETSASVSAEMSQAAAAGFLSRTGVGPLLLPGREVASAEARDNVWIVRLAPSGYIEVAGSTKCAPILSFSAKDFVEPEVGSPFAAKLTGDSQMVAEKESNESATEHADWAKLTAPVAKKRALLAAPTGTTSVVGPLMNCGWGQGAPFNDLSPLSSLCGCMATAAGQEHRYWRWPYRYEKSRQGNHGLRNSLGEYSEHVLRPDGRVPFNYDKVVAYAPNPSSTPLAADKEATYQTAWLSLWMQSLTGMSYKPGASGGTQKLCNFAEQYWFEAGPVMSYWRDGYTNLWNAIKADLDFGSPIQVNSPGHQMVVDGYAIENEGAAGEVHYVNINYGWGSPEGWVNLLTAVTENTSGGRLADFQIGYRPQKIVQFEPVPKVCASDVTLAWHIAPCYTNKINSFAIDVYTVSGENESEAGSLSCAVSQTNTNTRFTKKINLSFAGLSEGTKVRFKVTPVMIDGSQARTNAETTTIGTPQPAPEFLSVSSVACGIELLQQDIFIECAYGSVNKIDLTCSESTTEVVPYSSHLTILPDSKLSVTKVGNVFTVNVDATAMDPKWSGEMLVLTLVAKNADGTEAYKNLMLRFNSMRQVINGTFDAAEGDGDSPVWFCGDTTIDAKGRAVSFGVNAFQGTGKVTLVDSVGNGSFTFASLDNFKGTLVFAGDVGVTLPSDMSGFAGTLKLTSGTYTLSSDLTANATIVLGGAANDYESVVVNLDNVTLGASVTGWGTLNISSGDCSFTKTIASNPTLVNLTGGTLTIPADDSQYSFIQMNGGTLKIKLTEAQTQLGYKWTLPLYQSGNVKFVLSDSTEEDATVVKENNFSTVSHDTDANTWTGTDYWFNSDRYNDTTKWSKGALPTDGDYVIFNSAGDGDEGMNGYGTAMVLNLPTAVNLGYVQVRGDSGLEITTVSGISTAVLKVGVLENQIETKIKATEFQPETVIPKRTLYISHGYALTCDLDYRYADNLKQSNSSSSALISSDYWKGTVVISNRSVSNWGISNYGNAQSTIKLNGVTGSLMGDKTFEGVLELVDYDGAPAFDLNSGSSSYPVIIGSLASNGTFKTSGTANTLNILLKDISGWTGSFDLASKTVAIGQSVPSSYTGNDGRLHICQAATVASGATWKASGGLYLGAGGALTINGAVEAKNITTYGAGASVALEDNAVLQVSAASASDSTPTLNFKAGTFRVQEGSNPFRETAAVNFCAASGKRTVIDANGSTLTLGPNVFSGSGDVYLTSSKAGGKVVIEGISAAYTGTIYCDISCEASFGDLSKATNCNINVSDVILSRSSGDIGNLTIGLGATLEVTVTKADLIEGLEIGSVTLNDGATMVLKDKTGKELVTFAAVDAVDGKYVLAPDPNVTAECLLDYEFNGNMISVGTDTTGLNIWNGTASYDSQSEKIYMRCKPYINTTFAMPDDEWSVFMRCTLPAANSATPTMMLMFGKNGGNVFGLVAGTGDNTVALASKDGLIGEAVQVSDATSKQHVYTIVKTANRVRLYVDGVLKVDESATVSVSKEFQIGSVKNGNNTAYDPCDDANALIDNMKFYDFAVGQAMIDAEVALYDDADPEYDGPAPIAVWVAGEFGDDRSAHGGLEVSLNGNTTNALGQIVIGGATTLGATIALPDATHQKMTMLVQYSMPYGGAPAANSVPASMFSTYDLGARAAQAASSALDGYWLNGSSVAGGYDFSTPAQTMPQEGYVLISTWATDANPNDHGTAVYSGETLSTLSGGEKTGLRFTGADRYIASVGVGGPTVAGAKPWAGMVIKSVALFDEWVTPSDLANYTPADLTSLTIIDGETKSFTAGETEEYPTIGKLSSSGTIAIANASELTEGTYKLAEWTTPQQYTTQCAGYGKVGTLVTEGLAEGLSARLVYGARAIYLRVDDTAKQAARKPLVVWCYGDSITEGFNAQATGANYRILLYQKLEMLGYNVRSTGVYGLSNGYNSVDPSGTPLTDQYKWHSAKHGATAGPTTLAHRSNLSENVDTLAIQAGTPDVALLLIGVNDIPEWKNEADRVTPVFKAWTNVVSRMVKNLPDTKIVVSTILYSDGTRTDIDPTITAINTQIKNLFDNLPAEWLGHVLLADLNSFVKSGEPGIIYSDHLHPDWWGYDQMADGYLEKIVECYPDPDATNFPSQNPIPAAPAENQLGAANKPELAAYRAGFTKLCNIRVEKGQDVSNVVYDDVNSAAASNNLEKVGYFVEFVRDDNHAHKWVWVDMDAFGDADLASIGLPQRIYQQAVTKLHVCSNHGAIDNVAADDDSVTGWIEFSPYNYSNPQSNASAPENYGNPYDWNDTLSQSGSYGCMQVFRVMNPSSKNLYERPQLMFAFNNFQSANSNPADFGIGNFAQHFNCNNAYHTEDWTGVGGTLAKMAPEAYSVKTIEIWTKAATPAYVRDNIVTRADGTVYHGNDANRAIITNWEYQINRPVAPPAPNTIDILYVLDKPSREYIENTKNMSMDEFFAKSTAFMNQMLCPTDMDTNFWFRMVGVCPLDVQGQEVSPMLARSKNSSEPGFELVNEMRNRVGADIVFSVARNGGGIGGLAYVNSYENIMSGAAAPLGHACGFLEYSQMISWVHEIAHVMSCNHTPPTNIDVNNPRHRQFGVVVHDDNATEAPFDYRTIMTGWYYGGQTYCFSSRNHYYNGVQLSVSNHVDATQVMVELAPAVAQWRPTKVPERPEITFFPQDQAEIPAGVETMVSINYGDPEAEIYWYDATSGEGKSDARLYTGPISVVGGSWKMLYAFAKTNGVEVAGSEKTATYFLTGMYGRFDYSQVLDSDGITWSMPLGDSSDFAWDKDTENFCAGESSYRAHVDMESLTNSRPSTCSATAMLTLSEARNLNFRHLDSYTNAMFSVWVDDVPVYYKKGASDTGGEWRKEVIRIEPGTHRIEFVFTQTAEERVDAQTSEGDEHALVDDEKYQRYLASLVAAETSRVWIDGFEWTPTDMTWSGDETTGDGVWATDTSYAPWEGGVSFADDAVVTFPDLAAGSPTVVVKGMVRPSKVNFTGVNTAYTFVPQDENAFIYISNGSSTEFKTNAAIRVPFRLDAAYISSAAKCTLELGNVFGHGLIGPGSEGSFWGQVRVNSKSTVIMNPGAGRTQTVGDFGKNWSYTDSDLVFTNGTVKVNGTINGGNGLFQYKRIHVKNGAVLELVTTDATGYDVAANNTIEVERGGELRIDAGDRLRRPMKLSGGKLTVSRSGSVHALALYNNPSFTVTADSVLTNGNAAATFGFVGQDATIALQNDATLDCYVPFANGIMDGDNKNVTITGSGTFVQNVLMIQFTNKVTVANGVTFRQNAVTSGMVGKSSWDVNGTLEANAIMQVSALTLADGATLSVKVTDANVSNAAILCDATPSLAGSIVVNAASDLANGKYAVISATGLEDGLLARVSAPALAKRATFAVEEGGLFMTVADYTEEAFTDTDYPVPYSWMMEYYPNLRGNPSANTELQAVQPAASAAHAVWECYVLGLDPTNALSRFTATIRMEGQTPVVEYFPTNEVLKASGAIEYILQGKPALSNSWQNVTFDQPGATNRFFRVKVTW